MTKSDARGTGTNFGYDDLARLRTKMYSDGTPQGVWCYDGDANAVESVTRRGLTTSWSCTGAPIGDDNSHMSARLTMTFGQLRFRYEGL